MDPVITNIICICMALLFGVAVTHKLKAPAVFKAAMDDYQLTPPALSWLVAVGLIALELAGSVLVLLPFTRTTGLVLMAALLLVYTAGISINLLKGRRDIDCGCNGPAARQVISGWLVLRNMIFLGLVLLAALPSGQLAAVRQLNWLDLLVILLAVPVASGLYLALNQLLAQAPRLHALANES